MSSIWLSIITFLRESASIKLELSSTKQILYSPVQCRSNQITLIFFRSTDPIPSPQRLLSDEISNPKLSSNSAHVSLPLSRAGYFVNTCQAQGITLSARGADPRDGGRRRQLEARGSRATPCKKSQKQWSRHGDPGDPFAEIGRSPGFSTVFRAEKAPTRAPLLLTPLCYGGCRRRRRPPGS